MKSFKPLLLLLFIVFTVSTTVAQIPHDKNYKFLVGGDRCTRHLEDSTFDTMFQYDEMQKYEIVLNTPEDSLSLEALKEKASQGDDVAMLCLGNRYYTGKGVAKDENEAVKWYQQAAKLDNANAQNNLGYYYMEHADASLQGENKAEAIRLFDKARWSTRKANLHEVEGMAGGAKRKLQQKKGTARVCGTIPSNLKLLLRKVRDSNPRTHEGSTVFETAPIDHSGNFPWSRAITISRDCGCKISKFYRQ